MVKTGTKRGRQDKGFVFTILSQESQRTLVVGGCQDYKDDVFVKRPKVGISNLDFSNVDLSFLVVKNVNSRNIAEDIKSVKPKTRPW